MIVIHDIPGKVQVEWEPTARAIIDHWSAMALVTLAEFRTTVLEKGLKHATANGAQAYIVDNSGAKGAFSQEIQAFIGTDVFPAFAKGHIKYFLTVASAESALTNMAAKKYQAKLGPNGIQLVEVPTVTEALRWLRENAK
jgi:hypothetical protein